MPVVKNTHDHGVRQGGYRMQAGEVREVSGEEADALTGINGVEEASDEDRDEYQASKGQAPSDGSGRMRLNQEHYAEVRRQGKMLTVVIPLQEVIGDDSAPFGPPTGTITTKQAIQREADRESETRRRFGGHEIDPGEAESLDLPPEQQEQVDSIAALEELQSQVSDERDYEDEPQTEGGTAEVADTSAPAKPRRRQKADEQGSEQPKE